MSQRQLFSPRVRVCPHAQFLALGPSLLDPVFLHAVNICVLHAALASPLQLKTGFLMGLGSTSPKLISTVSENVCSQQMAHAFTHSGRFFLLFSLVICEVDIACIWGGVCSALSVYFLLTKCWGPKVYFKTLEVEG